MNHPLQLVIDLYELHHDIKHAAMIMLDQDYPGRSNL